ncbi:MAG: manganese efflux pump [Candidatus Tumulicola sp.]
MSFPALALIALALSADNFAIAAAIGASQTGIRDAGSILRLPLVFGACSFAAPVLGWFIGFPAAHFFRGYGGIVVFAVLGFVGWRMLRSAGQPAEAFDASSWRTTLVLGLATSGDAMAVGFGLALTNTNIAAASALIGAVTAGISLAGILLGRPLGRVLGARGKIVAGLVLMLAGVHALVTHA